MVVAALTMGRREGRRTRHSAAPPSSLRHGGQPRWRGGAGSGGGTELVVLFFYLFQKLLSCTRKQRTTKVLFVVRLSTAHGKVFFSSFHTLTN
jgi:hypothetical protein